MQIYSHLFKNIKTYLERYGISIHFKNDLMILNVEHIDIFLFIKKVKKIIYYILNNYENYYFVLIKGVPYCLFPDAHDHVFYTQTKEKSYKKFYLCKMCKYNSICPGISLTKKDISLITPILDRPIEIAIEVNKTCNLECKFCFYNCKNNQENLSYKKIRRILYEAKKLNIRYVRFTGGEPLLRKDIIKILKYTKSMNFYVLLNTNATLLNDIIIQELEKYIDNILISLCGYNISMEEKICSKENILSNKFKNILKLNKTKIPYIRIGTVISRLLIDNFNKYSFLVNILGIKNWELYRPMLPKSKILESVDYNITKNDLLKLLNLIYRLRKLKRVNTYIANALPFCITNKDIYKPIMHGAQFDDGHCRLVVDSKGFLKPSYYININLGDNIIKAWNHPFIRKINSYDYLPYKCKHCLYLRWCLGGSRYMANEYSGSYFSYDPLMKK